MGVDARSIAKAVLYYAVPAALVIYGFAENPLALALGLTWLGTSIVLELT